MAGVLCCGHPLKRGILKTKPYRIPCECGMVYIEETGRPMQDRIKEHDRDIRLAPTETSTVSDLSKYSSASKAITFFCTLEMN